MKEKETNNPALLPIYTLVYIKCALNFVGINFIFKAFSLFQVLAYLQAVIASRKNKTEQIAGAFLNEAAELHFSALHGLPLSIEYYEKLNPMFLIEIVKEYLAFCPKQVEN